MRPADQSSAKAGQSERKQPRQERSDWPPHSRRPSARGGLDRRCHPSRQADNAAAGRSRAAGPGLWREVTKSRLAVRATPADRPGDQQQDREHAKREQAKSPCRNWEFAGDLRLEKRQSQGHTRSVAAPGI